jgi:hypothetical protein
MGKSGRECLDRGAVSISERGVEKELSKMRYALRYCYLRMSGRIPKQDLQYVLQRGRTGKGCHETSIFWHVKSNSCWISQTQLVKLEMEAAQIQAGRRTVSDRFDGGCWWRR